MEDFSEEFKEERRLKFSENYWKTGIDLSSLVGDFERIELLTGAQKAMIPRKDIKQLKINMKWKGPIKRAKEYDSGQVLIGLANIEDIDKLSSCFGLLLTRIEYDKKLMREITKPEKLVLDRDLFEENIMNTAYSLRNEFIKVCDDPYVSPKILKPIGKKWYEMYKYFYKIYTKLVEIYGEDADMDLNENHIWYFADSCYDISETFVVFYNKYIGRQPGAKEALLELELTNLEDITI